MKNLICHILLVLVVIIAILGINGYLYLNHSPQFGASLENRDTSAYQNSDNFDGNEFVNQIPTGEELSLSGTYGIIKKFIFNPIATEPSKTIEPILVTKDEFLASNPNNETQLMWFGHATVLLQTDGLNLLVDPMLGDTASPHPWLGTQRYSKNLPIEIAELPNIDAVMITHDHYDHLDYYSIQQLDQKVGHYYVPLGVAAHLTSWGIAADRITELDWWDKVSIANTEFTFTPARHFSGRSYNDNNLSLWGGWVMQNADHTIYFSGDTGYGPHFKQVGEKFGTIDLALIDNGQYNKDWADIHLLPEETVRAGMDVNAKAIMPISWGAFTLSLHAWDEPVERVLVEANKQNQQLVIPQIGEIVRLNDLPKPTDWWREY